MTPRKPPAKKPAVAKARRRLRSLPWRKISAGTLLALVVIVFIPPLRQASAMVVSRAILFLATPLTPAVPDFDELPDTTKVLAADGSLVASLLGEQESGRRAAVALGDVPLHVRQAVLAAEDAELL